MNTIKRTFKWMAVLAVIHLMAIGGGVGYLVSQGHLNTERAREIVGILRGESDMESMAEDEAATAAQAKQLARLGTKDRQQQQVAEEIEWRNIDRYRSQLGQRLKLINAARVALEREREAFETQRRQQRAERDRRAVAESQPGHKKELEIMNALSPSAALDQLNTMSDADAAGVMFKLSTRKVKKIFEAARTEADRKKLTTIRELIRDLKPAGGVMASGGGRTR